MNTITVLFKKCFGYSNCLIFSFIFHYHLTCIKKFLRILIRIVLCLCSIFGKNYNLDNNYSSNPLTWMILNLLRYALIYLCNVLYFLMYKSCTPLASFTLKLYYFLFFCVLRRLLNLLQISVNLTGVKYGTSL